MVDLYNASFDLMINGTLATAALSVYETALTFNGVVWFWPFMFIMTLILVAIVTENPTMVGIYAILGNVALVGFLSVTTTLVFWLVAVFSVLLWMYSLFLSPKLE